MRFPAAGGGLPCCVPKHALGRELAQGEPTQCAVVECALLGGRRAATAAATVLLLSLVSHAISPARYCTGGVWCLKDAGSASRPDSVCLRGAARAPVPARCAADERTSGGRILRWPQPPATAMVGI